MPTTEEYVAVALGNAHEQGFTSVVVAEMGYTEIAALAEVELGPNGESPPDFYYVQVRAGVVAALAAEELALKRATQLADLKAAIRLFPSLNGMDVYPLPEDPDQFTVS